MTKTKAFIALIAAASAFAAPALAQSSGDISRAQAADQPAPIIIVPGDTASLVGSPSAGVSPVYAEQEQFGERASKDFRGVSVPLRNGRRFRLGLAEQFAEIGQYDRPAGDYVDNLNFHGGRPRIIAKVRF